MVKWWKPSSPASATTRARGPIRSRRRGWATTIFGCSRAMASWRGHRRCGLNTGNDAAAIDLQISELAFRARRGFSGRETQKQQEAVFLMRRDLPLRLLPVSFRFFDQLRQRLVDDFVAGAAQPLFP